MRNRELHNALREFALEAAAQLTTDIEAGAEIQYDVVEEPGTGSVLYRYQPLTHAFIGERWDVLRMAPACERAAEALGTGAELYLRVRGQPADDDAKPALRAMLERLYEDATDFHFPEERFERVYAEVERTLYEDTVRSSVVVSKRSGTEPCCSRPATASTPRPRRSGRLGRRSGSGRPGPTQWSCSSATRSPAIRSRAARRGSASGAC